MSGQGPSEPPSNQEPTMEQIGQLLQAVNSGGPHTQQANANLELCINQNFGITIIRLLQILVSQDRRVTDAIRQMAGAVAGRYIGGARSIETQTEFANRWKSTHIDSKNFIKAASLSVMTHPTPMVRKTGANIVASIAIIESLDNWQIMPQLIKNLKNPNTQDTVFSIILELMRSETTHSAIQKHILDILGGMVYAFGTQNASARQQAAKCLYEIVPLLESVMQDDKTREALMDMVLKCCQLESDMEVQLSSYQALVSIVTYYYEYIQNHFQHIFKMTGTMLDKAIKDEGTYGELGKQAIEFWSTTGETEEERLEDGKSIFGFVDKAAASFLALYLRCLASETNADDFDSQDWTLRTAASCSLEIFAHLIKDKVINNNAVSSWVPMAAMSNEWYLREAVLNFVGCVASGPSVASFSQFVTRNLSGNDQTKGHLLALIASSLTLQQINKTNSHIRVTAAWTFARICNHCPDCISSVFATGQIVNAMGSLIVQGSPKEISHACWSLAGMIEYWYFKQDNTKLHMTQNNVNDLVTALLKRIGQDTNVKVVSSCYETLSTLASALPISMHDVALKLLKEIFGKIQQILMTMQNEQRNGNSSHNNNNNNNNNEKLRTFHLSGCFGLTAAIIERLARLWREEKPQERDDQPVPFLSKDNVELIFSAFTALNGQNMTNKNQNQNNKNTSNKGDTNSNGEDDRDEMQNNGNAVTEEALHAIGALAFALNELVYPFLQFKPVQETLLSTLNSNAEANSQLCKVASLQISDLFLRCSKKIQENNTKMYEFGDTLVKCTLNHLLNQNVILEVKPSFYEALTTFCESFGRYSNRYWPKVINDCCSYACSDTKGMDMTDTYRIDEINAIRQEMISMFESALITYQDMNQNKLVFVKQFGGQMFQLFGRIIEFDKYNSVDLLTLTYNFVEHCITEEGDLDDFKANNFVIQNGNLSNNERQMQEQLRDKFRQTVIQNLFQCSLKMDEEHPHTRQLREKAQILFRFLSPQTQQQQR